NRFSHPHAEQKMKANPALLEMNKKDWEEITEEIFEKTFSGSPLQRAGYEGIKRNIAFIIS
ncbi:MAG TPA: tRNA epoxyqueuosine(34) reductase QueG, partial [Bacteroidia bacterium]|nr:tRNA epoxyqueuosine(34) reductase QueG [Bacteroidia bacterium]